MSAFFFQIRTRCWHSRTQLFFFFLHEMWHLKRCIYGRDVTMDWKYFNKFKKKIWKCTWVAVNKLGQPKICLCKGSQSIDSMNAKRPENIPVIPDLININQTIFVKDRHGEREVCYTWFIKLKSLAISHVLQKLLTLYNGKFVFNVANFDKYLPGG